MASISSTNSIGNTSLRGYGGMASGIDRDSIIEKMTLGTTTKINNQKKKITQIQWKQEAYRNISDQILDFGDKYTSFSSTNSLKDLNFFAKNIISVHGRDEATRFVTATGTSNLLNNVSLKGVEQLATSTVRQSNTHKSANGIETNLDDLNAVWRDSKLKGSQLIFEKPGEGNNKAQVIKLTLPDAYVDTDGKTKEIDYTSQDLDKLVGQLNKALETANIKVGDHEVKDFLKFKKDGDKISLDIDDTKKPARFEMYGTAMEALGYGKDHIEASNTGLGKVVRTGSFKQTGIEYTAAIDAMAGKKLTFNYDGSKKEVELINKDEVAELKAMFSDGESKRLAELSEKVSLNSDEAREFVALYDKINAGAASAEEKQKFKELSNKVPLGTTGNPSEMEEYAELTKRHQAQLDKMTSNLQSRLDRAFGKGTVEAKISSDGKLSFDTTNETSSLSIVSNDYGLLNNLGVSYGESNKVNLSGKLDQAGILGDAKDVGDFITDGNALDLRINGVAIEGLTKDSSINDILSKINSTTNAGVKATYVDATGQFMLVSSETGAGREISLDSDLSKVLFGQGAKKDDGTINVDDYKEDAGVDKGKNAIICVSYGNGVDVKMERASNTFDLEGLSVTVSGKFGGQFVTKDGKEVWEADSAGGVTFTAKADVDGIVERVKGFFEDFNKLAGDVNKEITTRPDSSYGPLTDEQKKEMDETSIENWENRAKQGMLYGDSAMRDLSTDVQGIFLKLMNNVGFEELKAMGITYSDDYGDGGTISFDESKFRAAVEKDSEAVGNVFTGGGEVSKGLVDIMDETFTPYATRYSSKNGGGTGKGSYGRLIEIAGSEKKPTTLLNNQLYRDIEDIQDLIERLQSQLKSEQDRYISQFTTMETLLNQMNTQSSYLSQLGS